LCGTTGNNLMDLNFGYHEFKVPWT
jgi:hypothetical protein